MSSLQTRALLLDADLRLRLGSREVAEPVPGEALVRIEWAGVCGSDLHAMHSGAWIEYWPAVLGHEIVGVVERCPGGEIEPGTRVVVDSRLPCGHCDGCARARNLCENLAWVGEQRPGGYEQLASFDIASLQVCPPGLEASVAVLAEPLAVAMHAVKAIGHRPDEVLLIGYGPIGSLVHLVMSTRWPQTAVSVVEVNPQRRELAVAFGAALVSTDARDRRWPVVVDAAGYDGSMLAAIGRARKGGRVVLVALAHQPVSVLPADLVEQAITLVGVNGFDAELAEAVDLLAASPDVFRPVITEALMLDEAVDRLASLASTPPAGKVVIRP